MLVPTLDTVLTRLRSQNLPVFETGDYNLNIVALRTVPGVPDKFDDFICVFYKLQDVWQFHGFRCTTDPGLHHLTHPENVNGTAILQPGRYPGCWKLGKHKGQYDALVQAKTGLFKVWRDRDVDGQPDLRGTTYLDVAGLNCHHAGTASTQVGEWSAGCVVLQRLSDWDVFIDLCKRQVSAGLGDTYSLTLQTW